MIRKNTLFAALAVVLFPAMTWGQGSYVIDKTVPVIIGGTILKNPWVGGFNAPIFSEIDLNGDGVKDLFVFDREGERISTYLNNGTPNQVDYTYAPQYRTRFPSNLHDWVLLVDFNCDGLEDIFTYSYGAGMSVYRNTTTPGTELNFTLEYNLIYTKYGTVTANLYVASVNLPVLADVDYDGDLDVLTFPVAGNFVEFHRNYAMDQFGRCDTLVYQIAPNCFGNFGLSGISNTAILNANCRTANAEPPPAPLQHGLHSGSCMIAIDIDGDHDKDLINGDILGDNLLLIINGGDSANANMVNQDSLFPVYDTPVDLFTFPSAYYIDINNDGNKDMVVAPCISGPAENYNNVLLYRNTTNNITNQFHYEVNRFLSDEMIEVGAGASPVFVDIDGDGLKDLVVGNHGYYSPVLPFTSGLAYFRNTGSASLPVFTLQTTDLGNFFTLGLLDLDPAFGDLDSDGDLDLLLGNEGGTLLYYTNTAGAGNPPVYSLVQASLLNNTGQVIDVGQFSAPQLVDVNRDGKLDLLIGEKSGNINYYQNTGSVFSPQFTLIDANLGDVDVSIPTAIYSYSNPCLYDSAGTYQLLVGCVNGYIYQYNNIDNNLNGTFTLVDSMFYDIHEPGHVQVDVADLDGDGILEIMTGNSAGGLALYKYDATFSVPPVAENPNGFTLYPNPASSELVIRFDNVSNSGRTIRIFDVSGRLLMTSAANGYAAEFDVSYLAAGIYQCQVIEQDRLQTARFVVR